MADILFDRSEGIGRVTLNRPEARNAITPDMVGAFREFLESIEHDRGIRCVLLSGAGEHFMAGGDVKSFGETLSLPPEQRRMIFEQRVRFVAPLLLAMARVPQIIIAVAKGAVAGAGVSFVAASDLAIAGRSSFFLLAQIKIGATPDGSGSYHLPRLVGVRRAKEIALLGERVSAEQAERWGLVNRVVDDAEVIKVAEEMARRVAAGPAEALAGTKRLINESLGNSLAAQLEREAEEFARCTATDDFLEGLRAFADKRSPRFGA